MEKFSSIDIICGLHIMIRNIQDNQNKLFEKIDTILNELDTLKIFCSSKDNIILKIQENVSTTTHDIEDIRSLLEVIQNGYQNIIEEADEEDDEEEDDGEGEDDEEGEDEEEEHETDKEDGEDTDCEDDTEVEKMEE